MKAQKFSNIKFHRVVYTITQKGEAFLASRDRPKHEETHYNRMLTALTQRPQSCRALAAVLYTNSPNPYEIARSMVRGMLTDGYINSAPCEPKLDTEVLRESAAA